MTRTIARLAIVVPTIGRRDLSVLLGEIATQVEHTPSTTCEVLVLDNGPAGSSAVRDAAALVGARYVRVDRHGVVAVRNAALDAAAGFDAVLFIDDDERPSRGWLSSHLDAAARYDADVVLGPVPVELPPGAPSWLGDGSLLRHVPPRAQGPFEGSVNSGNTLIRLALVESTGSRFDSRYNSIGGEDTAFFHELRKHGARVVWAPDAVAVELQDADRLTVSGYVRRSYAAGQRAAVLERTLRSVPATRIVVRRGYRVLRGAGGCLRAALRRSANEAVRGLGDVAFGVGSISALLGHRTHLYGRDARTTAADC